MQQSIHQMLNPTPPTVTEDSTPVISIESPTSGPCGPFVVTVAFVADLVIDLIVAS